MSGESGASWDRVSANYLQNFGMTILRGRALTTADNENTAPVAIVNQAFVKRLASSASPGDIGTIVWGSLRNRPPARSSPRLVRLDTICGSS